MSRMSTPAKAKQAAHDPAHVTLAVEIAAWEALSPSERQLLDTCLNVAIKLGPPEAFRRLMALDQAEPAPPIILRIAD